MADRESRMRVGYDVDRQSINRVIVSNDAISKSIEGVKDVLGDLSPATAAAANVLTRRFKGVGEELRSEIDEVERLRKEIERLDDVTVEPEINVKQSGGGGTRRGFDLDFAERGFGAIAQVAPGAAGDLARTASDATQLLGVLGPAGAIFGAVSLAVSALTAEQEAHRQKVLETAQALEVERDARIRLLAGISGGDPGAIAVQSAELRAQINAITQEQLNPLLSQRNDIQLRTLEAARTRFPQFDPNSTKIRDIAGLAARSLPEFQAVQTQIDAVNAALTPLTEQLRDLEDAGTRGAQIIRDIRGPLTDLQGLRGLQNITGPELNERLQTARANVDSYGASIENADQAIAQARRDGNSVLVDALIIERARLVSAQDAAQAELHLLETRGEAIATANDLAKKELELTEQRNAALKLQSGNYLDALTTEVNARERAFKVITEESQVLPRIAELEQTTAERRADITANGKDRLTDIEQRGANERSRVLRDFTRTYTQAVGERDSLAGRNARIAAADQTAEQEKGAKQELARLEKAINDQYAAAQSGYQRQLAALNVAVANEQRLKNEAYNRAQIDAVNAANQQANIAMYGAGNLRSINQYYWGSISQDTVGFVSSTLSTVNGIIGAYTGSYAARYPFSVGSQPPVQNTTVNISGTGMSASQLRTVIQSAARRSGGDIA